MITKNASIAKHKLFFYNEKKNDKINKKNIRNKTINNKRHL